MSQFSTNELRAGHKVMIDNDPCNILENEFVKPGKGQAFNRIRFRNLKTGKVLERTLKSGDTLEAADVTEVDVTYLYCDDEFYYFMNAETFEQYSANKVVVGDAWKWLKAQDACQIVLWNNIPISLVPAIFVTLKVTSTDPGLKGDTVTGGSKPATLETGAVVKVPLFVSEGDLLKIDTRTGDYISRVKE